MALLESVAKLPLGNYSDNTIDLFGASTPAGEKRGSLIKIGLASHSQLIEYGGLDTIASNGSSSQCFGSVSVFP